MMVTPFSNKVRVKKFPANHFFFCSLGEKTVHTERGGIGEELAGGNMAEKAGRDSFPKKV